MSGRDQDWTRTSADDSDHGWGEGADESSEQQVRDRLAEYERQRPPHAGE